MERAECRFIIEHDFDSRYIKNFINEITRIKSDVYFAKDNRKINAKSIIGLISLNIAKNDEIVIYVSGKNEWQVEADLDKVVEILGE